jgi:hypothetical protein
MVALHPDTVDSVHQDPLVIHPSRKHLPSPEHPAHYRGKELQNKHICSTPSLADAIKRKQKKKEEKIQVPT